MVLSLSIIHNHARMSPSITRILHTTTWDFFTRYLQNLFIFCPKVVMEAIMTDINDLVQEFWTSSDGADGASFIAMRRLLEILHESLVLWKVCFDMIFVLRLPST